VIDVSIIVIAHDVRDEVLACLRSVEDHRGDLSTEAIVVDNGSSDGTVAAVREAFPGARVVALDRNEGGSARNHGLRIAQGRHRMFLDSDATLTAGALPELVRFLDARPDVGLVGPELVYPDGGHQPSARRLPPLVLPLLRRPPLSRWFEDGRVVRRHLMLDVPHDTTREAEYVIGACMLFSRAAQEAAGELDPRIPFAPEDIDWCVAIRRAGLRIAYHPAAVVVHDYRRSTAQRPVSRAALQHLRGFVYFAYKRRHERRALLAEGAAMERRGWALPAPGTAPAPAPAVSGDRPLKARLLPVVKHWGRRALFAVAGPLHRGDRHECPCCGGHFRKYMTYRGESTKLADAWCPGCGSLQRHRALWLFIRERTDLLRRPVRVLHFAPEWALYRQLSRAPGVEYHTGDLWPSTIAHETLDITAIPYEDQAFDYIMVSHVLEHVEDDRLAMAELLRVLRPGGAVLLQHPIEHDREVTLEDPAVTTPEARLERFGQTDHVRVYGRDFPQRLEQAGLAVEVVAYADEVPAADADRYGLIDPGATRAQDIYVCRRPGAAS
jgi:GT2 family glycosyltransferase